MVSTCPQISKSFSPFTKPLGIVPSAPIEISITVTFMFHSIFCSPTKSRYLSLFSPFFISIQWSAWTARSTIQQVIIIIIFLLIRFLHQLKLMFFYPGVWVTASLLHLEAHIRRRLLKGVSFHTRLTHSFILKQEPQPQCLTCQTTCMVKHIRIECRTFVVTRKQFFKVNNLTDLFENVKIDDISSFLRETELYQKIWQLKTG